MTKTIYDESYRACVMQLKAARKRQGLTQAQVGKLIKMSRSWIGRTETYDVRLDIMFFVRLCKVYKLNPCRLMKQLKVDT